MVPWFAEQQQQQQQQLPIRKAIRKAVRFLLPSILSHYIITYYNPIKALQYQSYPSSYCSTFYYSMLVIEEWSGLPP